MLLLGAVLLFLVYWYVAIYNHPITNYPTPSPDSNTAIVAFGDSLAAGVGAQQTNGFVDILAEDLDIEIINHAQAGADAHDMWNTIDTVIAESPRIVILSVGTTDAVVPTTPAYQVASRLERMISTIHDSGSAIILLETASHQYGDMYYKIAREHQTALVQDVVSPLRGKQQFMFDEVHPNDAGHVRIADKVAPTLSQLLDQHKPNESDTDSWRDVLPDWLR